MKKFAFFVGTATIILIAVFTMGFLTIDSGMSDKELGPHWADTDLAREGQLIFRQAGCANCHSYIGYQGKTGGPMLDWIGEKYDKDTLVKLITDPPSYFSTTIMPTGNRLTEKKIEILAEYLATFKRK